MCGNPCLLSFFCLVDMFFSCPENDTINMLACVIVKRMSYNKNFPIRPLIVVVLLVLMLFLGFKLIDQIVYESEPTQNVFYITQNNDWQPLQPRSMAWDSASSEDWRQQIYPITADKDWLSVSTSEGKALGYIESGIFIEAKSLTEDVGFVTQIGDNAFLIAATATAGKSASLDLFLSTQTPTQTILLLEGDSRFISVAYDFATKWLLAFVERSDALVSLVALTSQGELIEVWRGSFTSLPEIVKYDHNNEQAIIFTADGNCYSLGMISKDLKGIDCSSIELPLRLKVRMVDSSDMVQQFLLLQVNGWEVYWQSDLESRITKYVVSGDIIWFIVGNEIYTLNTKNSLPQAEKVLLPSEQEAEGIYSTISGIVLLKSVEGDYLLW